MGARQGGFQSSQAGLQLADLHEAETLPRLLRGGVSQPNADPRWPLAVDELPIRRPLVGPEAG